MIRFGIVWILLCVLVCRRERRFVVSTLNLFLCERDAVVVCHNAASLPKMHRA